MFTHSIINFFITLLLLGFCSFYNNNGRITLTFLIKKLFYLSLRSIYFCPKTFGIMFRFNIEDCIQQ